jgi:hypothetical protein
MLFSRSMSFAVLAILLGAATVGCDESPTEPSPTCTYTLSANAFAMGATGGTGAVNVTAAASCAWTASSGSSWLALTGASSGTGSGVVTFSAAGNDAAAPRTGTLTVAEQAVVVTQEAAPPPCTYEVTPQQAEFGEQGGTGEIAITTAPGCPWTASSSIPWLEVTGGAQGTGNGTVSYAVASNPAPEGREGSIVVAGREVTVDQAPDLALCLYSVAPVAFSPCMSFPGPLTSFIDTTGACPWTATAGAPWIAVVGGAGGVGPGEVAFVVGDNYDAPRSGVVMVRWPAPTDGQNLQVAQAGCFYAFSLQEMNFAAGGGMGRVDVFQQSDPNTCGGALQDQCVWSAETTDTWITITTSMPRKGDDAVNFVVAANGGPARVGTIVVRDRTLRILQAGVTVTGLVERAFGLIGRGR